MKKLVLFAVVAIVFLPMTCATTHAFVLGPEWVEESASPFSVETAGGTFFIGYDVTMRNRETRAVKKLFESFETGEIVLSGRKELGSDGEIKNVVQLEPGGPVGVHAEFEGEMKESRLTGLLVRLRDEEGKDIDRRLFRPDFERMVSTDPIEDLQCMPGKKTILPHGAWKDFTCAPRIAQMSWFYPFGSDQVLVKNWSERSSMPGGGEEMRTFFAVRTRSGKWAVTEMVHDTVLLFDYLKHKGKVVAFEATLRDFAGNKIIRRMYKKPAGS